MAVSQETTSQVARNLLFASAWSDDWDVSDVVREVIKRNRRKDRRSKHLNVHFDLAAHRAYVRQGSGTSDVQGHLHLRQNGSFFFKDGATGGYISRNTNPGQIDHEIRSAFGFWAKKIVEGAF